MEYTYIYIYNIEYIYTIRIHICILCIYIVTYRLIINKSTRCAFVLANKKQSSSRIIVGLLTAAEAKRSKINKTNIVKKKQEFMKVVLVVVFR